MAAIANQHVLTNMASKFGGKTPVRVYFLDNSSKMFLIDSTVTIKDLITLILNKFEVVNVSEVADYFGLFESLNGSNIGDARKLTDVVADVVSEWSRSASAVNAKFIFMVRLFEACTLGIEYKDDLERRLACMTPLTDQAHRAQALTRDPGLIHLQYLQAVYCVITGQYPTSVEMALKLAMLHFTFKFGRYNPASHKVGFLGARVVEFIPIKHLKLRSLDAWESAVIEAVRAHHTSYESQSEGDALDKDDVRTQRSYLNEVFNLVQFGCTLFRCKVNSSATTAANAKNIPLDCFLGIQNMGIHVFEKGSSKNLVATYRIDEIFRWGFRLNEMFYFEVQSTAEESGVVEFDTQEGEKISVLLTDYAHAFVTEVERQDSRTNAALGTVDGAGKKTKSSKPKSNKKKTTKVVESTMSVEPVEAVTASVESLVVNDIKQLSPTILMELTSDERSAVKIQSIYRGYKDRCLVSNLIEKLLEEAGQI